VAAFGPGRHIPRRSEARPARGGRLDTPAQRRTRAAIRADGGTEDDDDGRLRQARRTFQKIGKPSGTPVTVGRYAVGSCANPSG
jgi:hypothetical protein